MRELTWAPGSIGVVDFILAKGDPELSSNERIVYLALFSRMGKAFTCYPKVQTLAAGTGLAPRTVQRTLRDLQAIGLVVTAPRYDSEGRQTSTLYRLVPPWSVIRLVGLDEGEGDNLTPQGDTATPAPDTLTPQGRQGDTHPVTDSHPGGASLTPEVTQLSNPMKQPNAPNAAAEVASRERDPEEVWVRVVDLVQKRLPDMERQLRECQARTLDGGTLVVKLPANPAAAAQVKRAYLLLSEMLQRHLGKDANLRLESAEASA